MTSTKEKGGYDVEFVGSEPKNVTCSICLFVLREPMQAEECGHRFCKSCIEDLRDKSENECITCPQDRIINKVFRDRGKERDILDYLIKCAHRRNGCLWNGELRDLEKHKQLCEYLLVSCENEGCREEVQRRYLEQHMNADCFLRNVDREYCKMEHNTVCEKRPMECKRCKRKDILKHMMNHHLENECPMTYHNCEYSDIGCQEKMKRECISDHKKGSTEIHLDCLISKFREQEKLFQTQLQDKENQLKRQETELDRHCESVQKQKVKLEAQQNTISSLKVELSETLKEVKELKEKVGHNSGRLNNLEPVGAFKSELIWVVDNFKEELESVKRRRYTSTYMMNTYSRTFFTKQGYQCKVNLYLNGYLDGKGTHVSLFLGLEKGPFDNALVWPMDATISFIVLKNCLEESKISFSSNESKEVFGRPQPGNGQWGCPDFIPHDSISNFIVNDTLTLKISVE